MPTIYDCGLIALDVYSDGNKTINGHVPVYVPGAQTYVSDHFYGAAYQGPSRVGVIAFRGSQEIQDWTYADVDIAMGRLPVDQMGNAFGFFSAAKKKLVKAGCQRLVIVGHSLGGGLAAVVAARITTMQVRGVTFNAPGMANCTRMVAPEDDATLLRAVRTMLNDDASIMVRAGAALAAGMESQKKIINKVGEAAFSKAEAQVNIPKPNSQNVWNVRTFHDPVSKHGPRIGLDYAIPGTNKSGLSLIEMLEEHTMGKLLPALKGSYLASCQV
jgi:pimeloyl-ACP methyl ester carboxylesterase